MSPQQKSSVLDMANLVPPFETDDDGESEAATTLRRGRFNGGVGDIADVFRRGVALASNFPSNSWTRRRRNFYLHARSSNLSSFAHTASPKPDNGGLKLLEAKPGDGGLKLLEAVSNLIVDEGIVSERGGAEDGHGFEQLQAAVAVLGLEQLQDAVARLGGGGLRHVEHPRGHTHQ